MNDDPLDTLDPICLTCSNCIVSEGCKCAAFGDYCGHEGRNRCSLWEFSGECPWCEGILRRQWPVWSFVCLYCGKEIHHE